MVRTCAETATLRVGMPGAVLTACVAALVPVLVAADVSLFMFAP